METEIDDMSSKLMGLLNLSDFKPASVAKEKVTADKLDWLFEYDGFGEFFTYIVDVVRDENVISADLLSRYDDLCQISADETLRSDDVLEVLGSLAMLNLQNQEADLESVVGLYSERIMSSACNSDLVRKELSLLHSHADALKQQSDFLQSQLQIERVTVLQKEEFLKSELAETKKLEEKIIIAASDLDDVSCRLLAEVCQLGALYASEQLVSGGMGHSGIMGALPLQDIYRMEEDYAAKFTNYTRKQLGHKGVIHLTSNSVPGDRGSRISFGGPLASQSVASNNGLDHIRNEQLAACFKALTPSRASKSTGGLQNKCLSFLRPGRSTKLSTSRLCSENNGDGRLTVEEMTIILQEIYADYGLALMERTRCVVERDRLVGCVHFLDNMIASVEKGDLSNMVPNVEANLTRADRKFVNFKLKMDSAFLPGSSAIAVSIDKLISLSVESILDCGLDLELKRKEYVLDKREKVIGYLKEICARGLTIRFLLENELKTVTETVRLGESVVAELKSGDDARLARKSFFSRQQFSLKQLPKYAVDSVNVFLASLHGLLENFPFPKENQLTCCKDNTINVLTLAHLAEHISHYIDNYKTISKTVTATETAIFQQTAVLASLINRMRAVLSNDGLGSSPKTMLANAIDRIVRETDLLEGRLSSEIRNVEELKQHMADPLLLEERMFFTKFFGTTGNENELVTEVISDLQSRLSF